jgi:hypothetical protein
MNKLRIPLAILWASPWSLLGLLVGFAGLATGGGVQRKGRVLEFWGGLVTSCLRHAPLVSGGAMAMTLGHTVLGQTRAALDITREHEAVHVRQYEIWGPLFVPAYFAYALALWLAGKDAYRDNPFEREAYRKSP